ncbi:MAG: ABC transporter permease [Candidatus Binatia bacterium]
MRRFHPFYFVRRAFANLRGAPRPAAVTASTIAVAVFLFGAFLLFGENVHRTLIGWAGEGDPILVYAKRGLSVAATEALARRIEGEPEVARARLVSPEEGMRDLRRTLGPNADVLEGVDSREVLPAVIAVGLREANLDPAAVGALAARFGRFDGVDGVDSEAAWRDRFAMLLRLLAWTGAAWAAILGFGALLVIGNSARLAALTRKDEIEVLRLVGASDSFILIPFFLEGAIQGLSGSALGVGALAAAFYGVRHSLGTDSFFAPFVAGLQFVEPRAVAALLTAGPLLGALGSASAAQRFVRGVEL